MKKIYTYLLSAIMLLLNPNTVKAQVDVNDSLALVDLYNSTHGNHWRIKSGWLTKPLSEWYGIKVSANRVTEIHLIDNNLEGKIPYSIGHLTNLTVINLGTNKLRGNIPASFASITTLTDLDLYYNQLSGHIPFELGNLANLQFLYLFNNQLSGHIPPELGNLKSLQALVLNFNQLSGNIPAKLGRLSTLFYLYLNNNQLTGNIPAELGNLSKLNYLFMQENQLGGSIPSPLGNLNNIYRVSFAHNNLEGVIPSSFINAGHLQELDLRGNKLSGAIPVVTITTLNELNIKNNNFSFEGIEALTQNNIEKLKYAPQKKIHIHQASNILSVYAGGTLSNNTYKWYKDGSLVSTINSDSTFTPTAGGAYNVEVINSIATELILYSDTVAFNTPNASQQNNIAASSSDKNKFYVYPNPAKNIVTILFTATGNYTIKLTDVNGNILQTKTGVASKSINTLQLNVSRYYAGNYFITITNGLKQSQTLQLNKE